MKQAFHIFRKDLRRLWIQIAALMVAIGYFAVLDVRWSASVNQISSGNMGIESIVGASIWFLIARAIHEESIPGENQFWLTRPYERGSLLASKALMAVFIVVVPLFVADCAILAFQSFPVSNNFGGLILRQLIVAAWLIVPPFAIASVTCSIAEDVMAWVVVLVIAGEGYLAPIAFPTTQKIAIVVALALLLTTIWKQYSARPTRTNRAIIAAAVLLPCQQFGQLAALSIDGLRNDPATAAISITPTLQSITESRNGIFSACAAIPVSVAGLRPNWHVVVLSQKDTFAAGSKQWSMGWRSVAADVVRNVNACLTTADLKSSANQPLTLHSSIGLAVFAEDAPISVTATPEPFDVPGIGKCQFRLAALSDKDFLACASPVWFPRQGRVSIAHQEHTDSPISFERDSWMPFNLLPGMSPVYKWATLPFEYQIREAIARHEQIEFQPETRIAVIRREITVKEVRFLIQP